MNNANIINLCNISYSLFHSCPKADDYYIYINYSDGYLGNLFDSISFIMDKINCVLVLICVLMFNAVEGVAKGVAKEGKNVLDMLYIYCTS